MVLTGLIALVVVGQIPNSLTPSEKAEGFELIFNGRDGTGWRGWHRGTLPKGWSVKEGSLAYTPGTEGGDICTVDDFGDFELRLEWKVAPGGNSGIFYRASERGKWAWDTAPEMQVLDDERHSDGKNPLSSAGSCYAMYPPSKKVVNKAGEWNKVRLIAKGKHIEHWLNGTKIVEYEIGSPDWKDKFAKSKYRGLPEHAMIPAGKFVLQDHGDLVWYRSIRLKKL